MRSFSQVSHQKFKLNFEPYPGYQIVNGNCENINECQEGTHICHSNADCTDTVGSFTCQCKNGFSGDSVEKCSNINECDLGTHDCDKNAICMDNIGSFTCQCKTGFIGNGKSCQNENECIKNPCSSNAVCSDTIGSFTCNCIEGFTGNGLNCHDINECLDNNMNNCDVNAKCENSQGSFACLCKSGYSGEGSVGTCQLDSCQPACHLHATCNQNFACECHEGYSGNGISCENIDECSDPTVDMNDCDSNAECTDTIGSYKCTCKTGFTGDGKTCEQIDFCENDALNNCDTNADCKSLINSYECTCKDGFVGSGFVGDCTLSQCSPACHEHAKCDPTANTCTCADNTSGNGYECFDDNECSDGTHTCHSRASCYNLPSTYACICHAGFRGDGENCDDIDECAEGIHNCPGNSSCQNILGNYHCTCDPGFQSLNGLCIDIDECVKDTHNCDKNAKCTNSIGSFNCECNAGYVGDGQNCDLNAPGCGNCGPNAHCIITRKFFNRRVKKVPECECMSGFYLDKENGVCVDINECSGGSNICLDGEICHNTPGSSQCLCKEGFSRNADGNCVDVDECESGDNLCHQKATCVNYKGGYNCQCIDGYNGNGLNCFEIDECNLNLHKCSTNAVCSNTEGSYTCQCDNNFVGNGFECHEEDCDLSCGQNESCQTIENFALIECGCIPGFTRDENDDCIDINECLLDDSPCDKPNSLCINFPGGYECGCRPGFRFEKITGTCVDVNECVEGTHACSIDAFCIDLEGLHSCACKSGYSGNGIVCEEDDSNPEACICGEGICDKIGNCVCSDGFVFNENGMTCDDIDECELGLDDCGSNTKCLNFHGSFTCLCLDGFGYDEADAKNCIDNNECVTGAHICSLNANCENYAGGYNCHCLSGFSGNGLECEDIDECAQVTLNHCHQNADCKNTIGDYECTCREGYDDVIPSQPGTLCHPNGNPCETGSHDCSPYAHCSVNSTQMHDLLNPYSCKCKSGFSGNGKQCYDIDECLYGSHSCQADQNCVNSFGSYSCECPEGYLGDGHLCLDIDECTLGTHRCALHSSCKNTIGDYICVCDNGFGGNMCSDIDECLNNSHNCHSNATCTNNIGSYTCNCNEGFFGNGYQCTHSNETDENPNKPCVIGDPHFFFESPNGEKICFSYNGQVSHPMLLFADSGSGLFITGILEKAGKATVFGEIRILTPGGYSASITKSKITVVRSGKIVEQVMAAVAKSNHVISYGDITFARKSRTNEWDVRIGDSVHFHVIKKHHLTISFSALNGFIDSKTKGVIAFFAERKFFVSDRTGDDAILNIGADKIPVIWSTLTNKSCWKIQADHVTEILGTSNVYSDVLVR